MVTPAASPGWSLQPAAGEGAPGHDGQTFRPGPVQGRADQAAPDALAAPLLGHAGVDQHHPVAVDAVDELRLGTAVARMTKRFSSAVVDDLGVVGGSGHGAPPVGRVRRHPKGVRRRSMSGPVATDDVPPAPRPPLAAAGPVVEIEPGRLTQVGSLPVRRVLPQRPRRTVGAWCFADHVGPVPVPRPAGFGIGPHPHMGLQTVTWLVAGELLHLDSLGSEQLIRPGQLNLMTAGHGVAHAEEDPGRGRRAPRRAALGGAARRHPRRHRRPSSTTRSCHGSSSTAARRPSSSATSPGSPPRPGATPSTWGSS